MPITRYTFLVVVVLFYHSKCFGQAQIRKLPTNINQPSINLYAPSLSGDGESMIFLSDYTDDGHHSMYYTTKKSVSSWNDPVEVSKLLNRPTMNYRGGYCLSFEGDMLIYTSRKSGLGGFELWYSNKEGNNWGAPKNFGSPINSASNEGTPSLSPDGEYLYYMRCDQMTEYKGASGCQLMVAKRKYNSWEEPVVLASNINTGNSQNPKILADGETLIFSSDQFGGKGGLDLYMTKKVGDGWSDPMPLDFMNTEADDQFISIPAKGRYLYTSQKETRNFELVQVLIPEEFQPKKVMRVQGTVTDKSTGAPVNANLAVFNVGARDRLWNGKIGDKGEFAIVLNEGSVYDLAVTHDDPSYMYYSKIFHLQEIGARDKQLLKIELAPISAGSEFDSDISFNAYSSEINDNTIFELRRLAEITRRNPSMQIQINVNQNNYLEDSVKSSPDLTEVVVDSIYIERQVAIEKDSTNNLESIDEYKKIDSVVLVNNEADAILDSLNQDSIESDSIEYEIVRELRLKYTYHNDRTLAQGEAIKAYLIERGAKSENISVKGNRKVAATNERSEEPEDVDDIKVTIKIKRL